MEESFIGQWTGNTDTGSYVVANIEDKKSGVGGWISVFYLFQIEDNPFAFWTWSKFSGDIHKGNDIWGSIEGLIR